MSTGGLGGTAAIGWTKGVDAPFTGGSYHAPDRAIKVPPTSLASHAGPFGGYTAGSLTPDSGKLR